MYYMYDNYSLYSTYVLSLQVLSNPKICGTTKTCSSESQGQEEAIRELFTHSTTQNLAGLVRKLLLRFQWPSMFLLYKINMPMMEEIGATNPVNQPLQILWSHFVPIHTTNHPSGSALLVTRELVPLFNVETVSQSSLKSVQPLFF